ncbi:hypothetical protein D3C76_1532410 [compost metagenome]
MCQNAGSRLLQDVLLGHVGSLGREVRITDTGARCTQVFGDIGLVADGRIEAVLHRTQFGSLAIYNLDHFVQVGESQLSVGIC